MSRRLAVVATVVVAGVAAILLLTGGRPGGSGGDRYRVDVIFDHARGLIPGQLVQIAGGPVGEIEEVGVTAGFKARIGLAIDPRFGPFREDARCTIRPQGLIAENFVQCDPGSADAPELRGEGGRAPAVGVERTSLPVNLTDLFELWNVPTRDRLSVLISELGISTAARGEDIDAILTRANPALGRAREVLRLLEGQRDDLVAAIDDSDRALARIAPRAPDTRRLLRRAASVLTRTGRRSADLALAVERLPALLRGARPALQRLGEVAAGGIPLLAQVNRSAPTILSLTESVPALAGAARPTIAKVGPVLDRGTQIVGRALPLSRALRVYARQSLPSAKIAGRLLPNLDERGFPDNIARFFFYAALATSRFDDVSHILPAHIDLNDCANYATEPQPGCSAKYSNETATRLMDYLLK